MLGNIIGFQRFGGEMWCVVRRSELASIPWRQGCAGYARYHLMHKARLQATPIRASVMSYRTNAESAHVMAARHLMQEFKQSLVHEPRPPVDRNVGRSTGHIHSGTFTNPNYQHVENDSLVLPRSLRMHIETATPGNAGIAFPGDNSSFTQQDNNLSVSMQQLVKICQDENVTAEMIASAFLASSASDPVVGYKVASYILTSIQRASTYRPLGNTASHANHADIVNIECLVWLDTLLRSIWNRCQSADLAFDYHQLRTLVHTLLSTLATTHITALKPQQIQLITDIMTRATHPSCPVGATASVGLLEACDTACFALANSNATHNDTAILGRIALSTQLACRTFHAWSPGAVSLLTHLLQSTDLATRMSDTALRDCAVILCGQPQEIHTASISAIKAVCQALVSRVHSGKVHPAFASALFAVCTLPKSTAEQLSDVLNPLRTHQEKPILVANHLLGRLRSAWKYTLPGTCMPWLEASTSAPQTKSTSNQEVLVGRLLRRCAEDLGWTMPQPQAALDCGFTVDFAWAQHGVCVEVDGPFHLEPMHVRELTTFATADGIVEAKSQRYLWERAGQPQRNRVTQLRDEVLQASGWRLLTIDAGSLQRFRASSRDNAAFMREMTASLCDRLKELQS